jgi:hypothetical protein
MIARQYWPAIVNDLGGNTPLVSRYAFPLLFLLLLLAAVGCDAGEEPEPQTVQLGEPFVLSGGQEATVESAGLRLVFSEVLQDSRCPTQVQCAESGQARIRLTAQLGEEPPVELEFNTNPAPGMTQLTNVVNGYQIELQRLDPYPEDPEKPIEFEEYQATLLVTSVQSAGPNE